MRRLAFGMLFVIVAGLLVVQAPDAHACNGIITIGGVRVGCDSPGIPQQPGRQPNRPTRPPDTGVNPPDRECGEGTPLDCLDEILPDPVPMTPGQAAHHLVAQMDLSAPTIRIGPSPALNPWDTMLVGVPYWAWTTTRAPEPVTASEGPITITMTAADPVIHWNFGDGTTKRCGLGTPWHAPQVAGSLPDSPTCGHRYEQPGTYTITATAHWTVHWTGMGESGDITVTRSTTNPPVTIREVHSLNTGPR